VVATTLGVPFVYHAEGFYPDEMVDGGFWAEGSPLHRVTRSLEGALRRRRRPHRPVLAPDVLGTSPVWRRGTPVIVVPVVSTSTLCSRPRAQAEGALLGARGGVGGRYQSTASTIRRVVAERTPVRLSLREPRSTGGDAAGVIPRP
jgi:hypothetical protein